ASWADRILSLNVDISQSVSVKKNIIGALEFSERCLVLGMYGLIESNQVNSWAYQYDMNFRSEEQLQILPAKNMIFNAGLSTGGAHSSGRLEDTVERFDDFYPDLKNDIPVVKSKKFMDAYIKHQYRNFIRL